MDDDRCRRRFATARRAILATVRPDGTPHVVPVVHALLPGDVVAFVVDHKPKRTTRLQRLVNLEHEPRVSLLVDHYDEDWEALWWVRADGTASLGRGSGAEDAVDALAARYRAYREHRPAGPVVVIRVDRWRGWEATAAGVTPQG